MPDDTQRRDAPTGAVGTPGTGVDGAPGGGTIPADLVGTNTETGGDGTAAGDTPAGPVTGPDPEAVTGTGAGGGTDEVNPLKEGTMPTATDGGDTGTQP